MDYKEKIEEKRKKVVDTLISFIEQDPTQWEAGWYRAPSVSPMNGKTQKNYKGLNAFYLYVIAAMKGYRDPRWLTFNQVKELGGNVRNGEKSSEVFFWTWYDKKTKKPFEAKTLEGMSEEEKLEYKKENVRPVIKFYQVFNGQQCENIPEYEVVQTPTMAEEERARQNDLIETVIAFTIEAARLLCDGQGDRRSRNKAAIRKDLRRKIMSDGFKVNFLRGRQFDGFATATVSKRTGLRNLERGINSESLAAVFPFVFTSIIEPDGFTLGYDYYPVILDIWKRDNQQYINSNMMVIGKSGSGKSFFTKTLLSLIYSENSRIYILDPENEYLNLCRNVGGRFIDVGNATEGRINPLHIYQILTDEGTPAEPEVVFAAHLQFLESFFRITLSGITSDSLEELNNIVSKVYEERGITEQTDCSQLSPEDFPVFDDLLKVVDRELDKETLPSRKANLERVKTYVAKLAAGGRFANLWNGASTLTSDERLVVFNFQSLLGAKNNTVSNAQMLVIMRYLDQQIINIREMNRLGRANIHPFVAIDEGYNFIDPENPVALDFVFLWYKRIRKYNGSIMFLTQNLSDILGNAAIVQKTTAIINNTQYSFIFSLAPADLAILTDLYRTAGEINDTERNQIANAGNGECFAICSARERTSFKVVASDVVYTLFDFPDALRMIADGDVRSPYKRNNTAG